MTKPVVFIKRHPVLTYVALVFAISWGGMLIAVGPGGIPANGELSEMLVLFAYLAMLAGSSVAGMLLTGLMVWVYERTHESLLLAMLMHTSLVAFWTILTPLALVGMTLVTYYLVLGAALWVVVAALAVANHGHLSRQPPLRMRVA